jgi:hypothetical protein
MAVLHARDTPISAHFITGALIFMHCSMQPRIDSILKFYYAYVFIHKGTVGGETHISDLIFMSCNMQLRVLIVIFTRFLKKGSIRKGKLFFLKETLKKFEELNYH